MNKVISSLLLLLFVSCSCNSQTQVEIRVRYSNRTEKVLVKDTVNTFEYSYPTEGENGKLLEFIGLDKLNKLNTLILSYIRIGFNFSTLLKQREWHSIVMRGCEIDDLQLFLQISSLKGLIIQGCMIDGSKEYIIPYDSQLEYIEFTNCGLKEILKISNAKSITQNYAYNEISQYTKSPRENYIKLILYHNPALNGADYSKDFYEMIPLEYRKYTR
jgi:hypothetical protein